MCCRASSHQGSNGSNVPLARCKLISWGCVVILVILVMNWYILEIPTGFIEDISPDAGRYAQKEMRLPEENRNISISGSFNFNRTHAQKQMELPEENRNVSISGSINLNKSYMEARRVTLNTMCELQPKPYRNHSISLLYSKGGNIAYCNIPKIASSFLKRFMLEIASSDKTTIDPFHHDAIKIHQKPLPRVQSRNLSSKNISSFLFVRDPYTRLFAGYIDKLLTPNEYWWSLGKNIVRSRNVTSVKPNCGHDVSFDEFINDLVSRARSNKTIDVHFNMMYLQCQPCDVKYDIIGKVETFNEDFKHVLNYTHKLENFNFSSFNEETEQDSIKKDVDKAFSFIKRSAPCISKHDALGRLWRKLQIRGLIGKKIFLSIKSLFSTKNLIFQRRLFIARFKSIPGFRW
ncbi:hypothetical protein ScPMuIL_003304 [Solemya velum]